MTAATAWSTPAPAACASRSRHLKPYRSGAILTTAPSPHLTVRRVTDWILRRPEHLTRTAAC
nr:hypothetical protein OG409_37475 [Streptomyces sp. NBC_00974]